MLFPHFNPRLLPAPTDREATFNVPAASETALGSNAKRAPGPMVNPELLAILAAPASFKNPPETVVCPL